MNGRNIYLPKVTLQTVHTALRQGSFSAIIGSHLREVMVDLELANKGDLLITRNNWCGRFRCKVNTTDNERAVLYVITIEKNGMRSTYAVHKFGNYHSEMQSSYDVIAHLPSNTETPYFKLYERRKQKET